MATRIQVRRDTLANWQSSNPTLADGEPAWVQDSKVLLTGDGSTDFNTLWTASQVGIARVLVYASGAYPPRPAGATSVKYIGPVQPTTWLPNDEWVNNA